jgi:replication fork clamp-binding protein CrfC
MIPGWGEFAHKPGVKMKFEELRKEIIIETERLVGKTARISHVPIILKIHTPNTLPLTLVDTPGMTRVS